MKACLLVALLVLIGFVSADVYLMGPRGSNCRLKGTNRNRDNANRMFDSQNNDRGGYNVGSMYYYEGSKMIVEWTSQHSCGNANNQCEFILQYTCDDLLRDGTTETTIPTNAQNCYDTDCDTDPRFGRHESLESYTYCTKRSRNLGLYTANQLNNNKKKTAKYTRQNAGGTRYAYECPEERDYYPYWGPTIWRDVAVLTNDPQRCAAYKAESQNVKGRYYCSVYDVHKDKLNSVIPITEEECTAFVDSSHPDNTAETPVYAKWTYVAPFGLEAPECNQNQYVRDNHHGNAVGGQMVSFNWTIPETIHERCAFRIRYNITSTDFEGFQGVSTLTPGFTAEKNNKAFLNKEFGFGDDEAAEQEAKDRGYEVTGNPNVDIFGSLLGANADNVKLQMNVNTAQFSRTFEDRSHRFAIRSREGAYPKDAVIHNLNVRGKRGNIVQVYPSVEYDFQPNLLDASLGDYIHFQWTGSDSNPNNNDGQGRAGSDRSNVVGLIRDRYTDADELKYSLPTEGARGANYPKKLTADYNFLGWDNTTLIKMATLSSKQLGGDMDELDDAGTYFDMPPKPLGKAGIFNYMCTRNNNFSNRSQKGMIKVDANRSVSQLVGWSGGVVKADEKASIVVKEGDFQSVQQLSLTVSPAYMIERYGLDSSRLASSVVFLSGNVVDQRLVAPVELVISHTASPIADTYIAYAETLDGIDNTSWKRMSTNVESDYATTMTDMPGVYIVKEDVNIGAVIGITLAVLAMAIGAFVLIRYCRRKAIEDQMRDQQDPLVSGTVNSSV